MQRKKNERAQALSNVIFNIFNITVQYSRSLPVAHDGLSRARAKEREGELGRHQHERVTRFYVFGFVIASGTDTLTMYADVTQSGFVSP